MSDLILAHPKSTTSRVPGFAGRTSDPIERARFSVPLLRQMDWKKLQELVTVMLTRAGFQTEIAYVRPDAAFALTVMHPSKGTRTDAFVQCPPWGNLSVDLNMVKELFNAVLAEGASRGIFITPGEFSDEARTFAAMRPLELIDGQSMLRSLLKMGEDEQEYYLKMATIGQYTVPSCPACSTRMELREDTTAEEGDGKRDVVLQGRQVINHEVVCRSLLIKPMADVQFMKPVFAQEVMVQGRATGNVTVQGKLTVANGGILSGLVAAKTISMDEGGELEAEARILRSGEVIPVYEMPVQQVWRCGTWPRCKGQLPLRNQ